MPDINILTKRIIGCCFKVHKELGPGFIEKTYHNALILAFEQEGVPYQTEKEYEVLYLNKKVGNFRLDLVVDNNVIVEIKALSCHTPQVFEYQLLSYLKSSKLHIGLLVNFGNKSCQIKRLVL